MGVSTQQLMLLHPGLTSNQEKLCLASTWRITCMEDAAYLLLSVTIDYLDGGSFLLCYSYHHMLPLGLCQYLEDWYVFTLGPQYFSLTLFSQDTPTPVPLLLFSS